jgi:alkyl sulfatase BDS1-like metallo-beta-lactamase superfamily hydrolase
VTELRNGALNHRTVPAPLPGTTTFTLTRPQLIGLVTGRLDPVAALTDGSVVVDGDAAELAGLVGLIAPVDPAFSIVTP